MYKDFFCLILLAKINTLEEWFLRVLGRPPDTRGQDQHFRGLISTCTRTFTWHSWPRSTPHRSDFYCLQERLPDTRGQDQLVIRREKSDCEIDCQVYKIVCWTLLSNPWSTRHEVIATCKWTCTHGQEQHISEKLLGTPSWHWCVFLTYW